ncbi:MAG: hypothetical protein IJX94_06460 [Clostridia bacterium]|nr:hypothetical protein [Clostridia bacterium]
MEPIQKRTPPDEMIYPFGFGFELMENETAMAYFRSLDDKHKRELMKKVLRINTPEEMRGFVEGLGERKMKNE